MSAKTLPTPEKDAQSPALPTSSSHARAQPSSSRRPQRVLACLLCQQRKVKCDRRFPCANCVKHDARCVPATQPRRRKRRFPERELLDRVRRYEDLLRMNGVRFEPMHGEETGQAQKRAGGGGVAGRRDAYEDEGMESDEEEEEQQQMQGNRVRSAADMDSASPSTTLRSESNYEAKYVLFISASSVFS
jgi:hypothetical protein